MNPQSGTEEHEPKINWIGLMRAHGRFALIVAASVALLVAVIGGAYLKWGQPTQRVASLEFRPTFAGLADLQYPNGLPFSPNDVTAGPIIDMVFDANNIAAVCDREAFRTGFFVEQRSDQSIFLDLEYQSRLTEPRITMVERKLLQEEHATKRKALPLQYRLVFVAPPSCTGLTSIVISKVMVDVLATWASESDTKRGVLKHQIEVLTPALLDVKVEEPGGPLLRADLLRTALHRMIQNIEQVQEIPGAVLIRFGPGKVTFAEVQGKLVDLVESRLDPLVMTSGRSMVSQSSLWVVETVDAAARRQRAAEQKVRNFQEALRHYSGTSDPVGSVQRSATTGPVAGGNTGSAPPLDNTFINRIIELSEPNVRFRQQLTESMVEAQTEAVSEGQRASYYRRLLELSRGSGSEGPELLDARLDAIVATGKDLAKQFGDLYDEFSRVALRSSAALYEARKPVTLDTAQQFARRSLLNFVVIAFVGTLLLTFGFFVARSRLSLEHR